MPLGLVLSCGLCPGRMLTYQKCTRHVVLSSANQMEDIMSDTTTAKTKSLGMIDAAKARKISGFEAYTKSVATLMDDCREGQGEGGHQETARTRRRRSGLRRREQRSRSRLPELGAEDASDDFEDGGLVRQVLRVS